ncbi:MAG TPA: ISAs1 family transposase, partial [Geminicoccaceae bacterium]|nr:ISAs1 family transposase [Geminicoccaceae bacterium]
MEEFAAVFAALEDPRTGNAKRHLLLEILPIALGTLLSGGTSCADMALFGRAKRAFLAEFLTLPHGIPSHDTFSRVFRLLDPVQFGACFTAFMRRFAAESSCQGGVVAIDGKTLRRSFDRASGASPLHLVSAWACEQRLVLGQLAVDGKSNEITAVPRLLA